MFYSWVSVKVLTDGRGTNVVADLLPLDYGGAFRRVMLLSIAPTRIAALAICLHFLSISLPWHFGIDLGVWSLIEIRGKFGCASVESC